MVGQHHAPGADTDPFGTRGEVSDEHARRRARDRGHVVVLGDPESYEPESVGGSGEALHDTTELARGAAFTDDREVEDGQVHHAINVTAMCCEYRGEEDNENSARRRSRGRTGRQ